MKYYNYPNGTKTAEALDSENTSVVKGPDGKYIAPNELPAITANDKGKIVRVKADGTGIEYTGEAELPPITSSDGGKVCKVKSDHSGVEWGEAGGGGGNVLHVVFGWDEDDNPICDHSFSEVFNALERKDLVIFSESIANGAGIGAYAISCDYGDDYIAVGFNTISVNNTKCTINTYKYTISPDNTIEYTYQALEVQGTPVE